MKVLSILLVAMLLVLAGCGQGSHRVDSMSRVLTGATTGGASSASSAKMFTPTSVPPKIKDSNDADDDPTSNDDSEILGFGSAASETVKLAVAGVVKRYYAAAAADNAAKACSLIYAPFERVIGEDYGAPAGSSAQAHATCKTVLAKWYAQHRDQLGEDATTLKVAIVRVSADQALVLMRFGRVAELRRIPMHLEGTAWKVQAVLDSEMP